MPTADFFVPLGFHIERNLLGKSDLEKVLAELRESESEPARVGDSYEFRVDAKVRSTLRAKPSGKRLALVSQLLEERKSILAEHFSVALDGFEEPQFLVYRQGDFFQEHLDQLNQEPRRQVSMVIFLNGREDYRGGELTFFGLFDEPQWKSLGFSLDPEPGLLVAFRSHLLHEVRPVESGLRYSAVSWFY